MPHFILRDEKSCQNACVILLTAIKAQIETLLLWTYKGKKEVRRKHTAPLAKQCALCEENLLPSVLCNNDSFFRAEIAHVYYSTKTCLCFTVSCFLSFSKMKLLLKH